MFLSKKKCLTVFLFYLESNQSKEISLGKLMSIKCITWRTNWWVIFSLSRFKNWLEDVLLRKVSHKKKTTIINGR